MKYIVIILMLVFFGCSQPQQQVGSSHLILPDSLFPFHMVQSTTLFSKIEFGDDFDTLTFDGKKIIKKMDITYFQKYVVPVLAKLYDIDRQYAEESMQGYFIAKQKDIYGFTPIIEYVVGDDFEACFYLLLDKNTNIVSYSVLDGGIQPGPYAVNDTLSNIGEKTISFFRGANIASYTLKKYIWSDERNDTLFVDSICSKKIIRPNGKFEFTSLDSTRVVRYLERCVRD